MGCYVLTETLSRHHELGLDSYDRLFSSQDTLPRGGFGNLIALPLQREARREGNSPPGLARRRAHLKIARLLG